MKSITAKAFVSSKALRGEADAASLAAYRLELEFERKYAAKDPAGFKWVMKHLNTIRTFLDHIDRPLQQTADIEQMMRLTGIARWNSATVKERIDFLSKLYEQLKAEEEWQSKPRVIATRVS